MDIVHMGGKRVCATVLRSEQHRVGVDAVHAEHL